MYNYQWKKFQKKPMKFDAFNCLLHIEEGRKNKGEIKGPRNSRDPFDFSFLRNRTRETMSLEQ